MKPLLVKKPNPIHSKCVCGLKYVLTLSNRLYACSGCGVRTLYVPNTSKGYYAVEAIKAESDS